MARRKPGFRPGFILTGQIQSVHHISVANNFVARKDTMSAPEPPFPPAARLRAHLALCRVDHWVKNVFVIPGAAVAYSVAPEPLGLALLARLAWGFAAIGLITSSNYVINEVLDAPYDRLHPAKRNRPAARGVISPPAAYAQWLLLLAAGLVCGLQVNLLFAASMAILWLMGCLYNIPPVRTKDIVVLDVLSESVNNPLRMLAGWYLITTAIIPPASLLIAYWFVGCYFMAIKRLSELREIGGETAAAYRISFQHYSEPFLLATIAFYGSLAMLLFGAFVIRYRLELALAFPLVAWVMALYLRLAFQPDSPAQHPELLYKQPLLVAAVAACVAAMAVLLYVPLPWMHGLFAPTLPLSGAFPALPGP